MFGAGVFRVKFEMTIGSKLGGEEQMTVEADSEDGAIQKVKDKLAKAKRLGRFKLISVEWVGVGA